MLAAASLGAARPATEPLDPIDILPPLPKPRIRTKTAKVKRANYALPSKAMNNAKRIEAQCMAILDEDGNIKRRAGPLPRAAALRGLVGDDVEENPLRKFFYRVPGSDKARIIGGEHLISITDTVDWEDGMRYDRNNCSPDCLAKIIAEDQAIVDTGVVPPTRWRQCRIFTFRH
jgi:hypothetical protein